MAEKEKSRFLSVGRAGWWVLSIVALFVMAFIAALTSDLTKQYFASQPDPQIDVTWRKLAITGLTLDSPLALSPNQITSPVSGTRSIESYWGQKGQLSIMVTRADYTFVPDMEEALAPHKKKGAIISHTTVSGCHAARLSTWLEGRAALPADALFIQKGTMFWQIYVTSKTPGLSARLLNSVVVNH